ncbi:uncharacterized protein [Solanum tuberosum]|nr:PREDICTED: uncharacterized protein LOC107060140 [Solanum tuberosum]
MEIVVSVMLLLVGIAVLVFIHVCIVGRAFTSRNGINGTIFNQTNVNRHTSMSQEDIKKLPCFDYKMESTSPVDCAVCLENFKKTAVCPICRASAKSILETEEQRNDSSEVALEMT